MAFGALLAALIMAALAAVLVMVLDGPRSSTLTKDSESSSLSFIGGILSALFTVVLAFYVVFSWQTRDNVETDSSLEANALIDSFWQADQAPEPVRTELTGLIRAYANQVAGSEWQLMENGMHSAEVSETLAAIRARFTALPVTQDAVGDARRQGLADVQVIENSRRARLGDATGEYGFNLVLLTATIIGAALVIAFPLILGLRRRAVNITMMVLLGATIGATLYLSQQMIHPMRGPFAVTPDALRSALVEMRR